MELAEAIGKFKSDLAEVKAGGKTEVEIKALEGYLDQLLSSAGTSAEQRRAAHEFALAAYNARCSTNLEDFRVVMQAGKETINAAIIINGGAVIGLMSFLANSIGKPSHVNYLLAFAFPLLLLGSGVFLGGVAYGTRYIAQFFYAYDPKPTVKKIGHAFSTASWISVILSFLCFVSAILSCYGTLLGG